MVKYGAITAGMLDGGSSSLMYYEDYFTKYGIDESTLDEYQKKGLVNHYKAFTNPRRIPTISAWLAKRPTHQTKEAMRHEKDTFDNKYLLTETGDERFEPAERYPKNAGCRYSTGCI